MTSPAKALRKRAKGVSYYEGPVEDDDELFDEEEPVEEYNEEMCEDEEDEDAEQGLVEENLSEDDDPLSPSSDDDDDDDYEEKRKKPQKRTPTKTSAKTTKRSNSSNRSKSPNTANPKRIRYKPKPQNTSGVKSGQVSNLYQIYELEDEKLAVSEHNYSMNEERMGESDSAVKSAVKSPLLRVNKDHDENTPSDLVNNLKKPYNRTKSKSVPIPSVEEFDDEEYDIRMNEQNLETEPVGVKLSNFDNYQSLIEKKLEMKKGSSSDGDSDEEVDESNAKPSKDLISDHITNSTGTSSQYKIKSFKQGHYINCDLRYFSLETLGKFDVILIDPPWRVVQSRPQEAMMFSNTNFRLNYNTLSYQEIMDINVGALCDQGFCFLWVLNSSLQFGLNLLNHWGFTYIDRIVWVKKTKNDQIFAGTGYYFLHSTELLLVGVKHGSTKKNGQKLQYISKVTNDILFSKVGIQSQKPNEQYEIIENMVPGARKIELFARNHNVRKGWLSLGNRLGEPFDHQMKTFSCHECDTKLFSPELMGSSKNIPRYKSYKDPSVSLCEKCSKKHSSKYGPYFVFENSCTEPIFHDWYSCDVCEMYPICGSRFSCKSCDRDYDVCEDCFDNVMADGSHDHGPESFTSIEFPDPGCGYAVHVDRRCSSCLACPIIGERFMCMVCKDLNLCRKCFFLQKEPKGHKCTHEISLIPEPRQVHQKLKCASCDKSGLQGPIHKCKTCMSFVLCNKCFKLHKSDYDALKLDKFTTHKQFHSFMRMK